MSDKSVEVDIMAQEKVRELKLIMKIKIWEESNAHQSIYAWK